MSQYILSIDQGTTNTKALLVGQDGRPVFAASAPVRLDHPRAGCAEQDPEELWASVEQVVAKCLDWLRGRPAAVAVANQRETALAWDRRTGRAVAPAIGWQCRRSEDLCTRLGGAAAMVKQRSGLVLDPLLSATKWAWLLEQDRALAPAAERGELCFGTMDSWLVWKLTGGRVHACDHTNASRTGLLSLRDGTWDAELGALFGVPTAALPQLRASADRYGACLEGRLQGVPILAAIGDSHAALLGHGDARVKATYGTGSSLLTSTDSVPESDCLAGTITWSVRLGTGPASIQYGLEGNISMAGSALAWVGDFLGISLEETLQLAASVPDSAGVNFVPAMSGLGAPHWRTQARGLIANLESGSRAAHLACAAMEAIAFQVRDVLDAMDVPPNEPLCADGGATRNDALMQLQADVLGRSVLRSACKDLSALGAAWLAGLSLGWWSSVQDFASLPEATTRFDPKPFDPARYASWQTTVQRALLPGAYHA